MNTPSNFRQIAYSDGYIHEYKKIEQSPKIQKQLYIEELPVLSFEIENNQKFNISKYKKIIKYVFKRLLMFMIHLGLISLFEIIFFFKIVSQYENQAILNLIGGFFNNQQENCQLLNSTQKAIFTEVFSYLFNVTEINNNSLESYNNRKSYNYELYLKSWYYFIAIVLINIFLMIVKFYYKIKINLKKICMDNLFMIIILGIYEYIFLKSIILQYNTISGNEVIKFISDKYTSCLT